MPSKGFGKHSVEELQELFDLQVDGKLGPRTRQAVSQFQGLVDIPADGIPGKMTWDKLENMHADEVRSLMGRVASTSEIEAPNTQRRRKSTGGGDKGSRTEKSKRAKTKLAEGGVEGGAAASAEQAVYAEIPLYFHEYIERHNFSLGVHGESLLSADAFGGSFQSSGKTLCVSYSTENIEKWLLSKWRLNQEQLAPLVSGISLPSIELPIYVSNLPYLQGSRAAFERLCQSYSMRAVLLEVSLDQLSTPAAIVCNVDNSLTLEGAEVNRLHLDFLKTWPESLFFENYPGLVDTIENAQKEYAATEVEDSAPSHVSAVDMDKQAGRQNSPEENSDYALSGFVSDDIDKKDQLGLEEEVRALCGIIASRDVEPPLSIGLFGDWGTGKSFFIKEMIACIKAMTSKSAEVEKSYGDEELIEPDYWSNIAQITFNAWHFEEADLWASLVVRIYDALAEHIVSEESDHDIIKQEKQALFKKMQLLEENIDAASKEIADKENEKLLAEKALQKQESELDLAKKEVEEFGLESVARTVFSSLVNDVRFKAHFEALDISTHTESFEALEHRVNVLRSRSGSLRAQALGIFHHLGTKKGLLLFVGVLVFGVLLSPLSEFFLQFLFDYKLLLERWHEQFAQLLAWAAGVAVLAKKWVGGVKGSISRVEQFFTEYEKKKQEGISGVEQSRSLAMDKVKKLQEQTQGAREKLAGMEESLQHLHYDMEKIKSGGLLQSFLSEKISSDFYRKNLGIVASIREDFSRLSKILVEQSSNKRKKWKKDTEGKYSAHYKQATDAEAKFRDVDRIVLYIDDLDRCAPDRVVKILRAVHLLLAFKLFVVVVAVDSRWLLNSLKLSIENLTSSKSNRRRAEDPPGISDAFDGPLVSTPQNYLEKIFQIPYAVKPMQKKGFYNILEDLSQPVLDVDAAVDLSQSIDQSINQNIGQQEQDPKGENAKLEEGSQAGIPGEEKGRHKGGKAKASLENMAKQKNGISEKTERGKKKVRGLGKHEGEKFEFTEAQQEVAEADIEGSKTLAAEENTKDNLAQAYMELPLNLPQSKITQYELDFMKIAFGSLITPRSANRFVNTYRLIRSLVSVEEHEQFFHREQGDYQAVIILLIVLIGFSDEAEVVYNAIAKKRNGGRWQDVMLYLSSNALYHSKSKFKLMESNLKDINYVRNAEILAFQRWVRFVSRFSFRPIKLDGLQAKSS